MTVDNRMLRQVKDRPIRIAVLDTGFDRSHADFQQARTKDFLGELGSLSNPEPLERPQCSRIVASRDFCRPSTANGGCGDNDEDDEDDVADLDGHGTKVAGILLRLAPYSELLIARVCLGEESSSLPENQVKFQTPQPDIVARVRYTTSERK
jgi:subtilisin family serine protease